ncbi:MAG: phage baseplate assembly protein V [Planctomycetota bacterium]
MRLLVARARLERTDGSTVPRSGQVRLLSGEVADRVHVVQEYGFASRPPAGSEAVVVCAGGDRSHPIVVGTLDRRNPGPELAEGDVAVFSSSGDVIVLQAAGGVAVKSPAIALEGDVSVSGSLAAEGDVSDGAGALQTLREIYDVHTHPTPAGPSGPPTPLSGAAGGQGVVAPPPIAPPPDPPVGGTGEATQVFGGSDVVYVSREVGEGWTAVRFDGVDDQYARGTGPRPQTLTQFEALEWA